MKQLWFKKSVKVKIDGEDEFSSIFLYYDTETNIYSMFITYFEANDYTTENVVQIFESNNLNDLISTFRKFRQNCIQIENEWFNSHDNSKLINIDIPCGLIEFTQEDFEYILEKYEF